MTRFLSNEGIAERSAKSQDVDGSCKQKRLDASITECVNNAREEVCPGLRGEETYLDGNQYPDLNVRYGVAKAGFYALNLISLAIHGVRNAEFSKSLLLFREPGLLPRSRKVW